MKKFSLALIMSFLVFGLMVAGPVFAKGAVDDEGSTADKVTETAGVKGVDEGGTTIDQRAEEAAEELTEEKESPDGIYGDRTDEPNLASKKPDDTKTTAPCVKKADTEEEIEDVTDEEDLDEEDNVE
jgi:hypothetical protein